MMIDVPARCVPPQQSERPYSMKSIVCLTIVVATSLMISGCHTTRLGQSIGFPTPQERGIR